MTTRVQPVDAVETVTDTVRPLPEGVHESERDDYERELRRVMHTELARAEARRIRREREVNTLDFEEWVPLTEVFATEPEGGDWLIEGLLPDGGSALLSAQYKAGKTTTAMNLIRSLTLAEPFLGAFAVHEPLRVAYFDLELGFRWARKWFLDIGPEPGSVLYADRKGRGAQLDVRQDAPYENMVSQLRKHRIDVLIIDPVSALCSALGINENLNEEVRPLMDRFDAVARGAGCRGVVAVHHTGHTEQGRGRGASAFSDWPSALWSLESDKASDVRRFSAKGRDVDVARADLSYDHDTRILTYTGNGPADAVAEYFQSKRGGSLTAAMVVDDLGVSKPTALKRLEQAEGWTITTAGSGRSPDIWGFTGSDLPDPFG